MMERPKINDKYVLENAANRLCKYLVDHGFVEKNESDEGRQHTIQTLFKVLKSHHYDCDGYKLARTLDRDYLWEINEDLVEALAEADGFLDESLRASVRDWVRAYQVQPQFSVGDAVEFERFRKGRVLGEIVEINRELATYTIFCESLGHVRTGPGMLGSVLPYEQVKAREQAVSP